MDNKIAAIVTSYNYDKYIQVCIDSLLNQTIPFSQIIVVDDGSSDNTKDVLARYEGKIEIIYKENGGPLSCYIAAFNTLETNYFLTIDADDWARSDLVEKVLPQLSSQPVKVQFQLQGVKSNGEVNGSIFPPYPKNYNRSQMISDNSTNGFYISPPTSGNVFSKHHIAALDLEGLGRSSNIDGTPSLLMPYFGEIKTVYEPLVYYRVHDKNMSGVGKHSTASIQRQIDAFIQRWEIVRGIKSIDVPAYKGIPAYLAERYLLIRARNGQVFLFSEIFNFVRSIIKTNYGVKQRLMFSIWALAFVLPIKPFRNYLIDMRINGTKRSPLLIKFMGKFLKRSGK